MLNFVIVYSRANHSRLGKVGEIAKRRTKKGQKRDDSL
jgi:hypothetical protein